MHKHMHMCVLSHFSHVQLSATQWTVTLRDLLSKRFSRQEFWSVLPCPPPGDLPGPEIMPTSPAAPVLQADSLPLCHCRKPKYMYMYIQSTN